MDVKNLLESEWLGVQFVKDSPSKTGVIINPGVEVASKDGLYMQAEFLVEIDGKRKKWKANKTSMRNLAKKYGTETSGWLGQKIVFMVMPVQSGREGIIANPLD